MNFIVLNASPKNENSITLQHIKLFEKMYPQHQFEYINIAAKIPAYEKRADLMDETVRRMQQADATIWSFPVYYMLVPSQLKRFMELLFERYPNQYFEDCYTTCFSTSIHFCDHMAHNYMHGVCEDLGFSFIESYSAHMEDFFNLDEMKKMKRFFLWFAEMVSGKTPVQRKYPVIIPACPVYEPDTTSVESDGDALKSEKILLLTDEQTQDVNLKNMTDIFTRIAGSSVQKENIYRIGLKNGCLGCCTCGYDNNCRQKDGFTHFYNTHVKTADTIVIAGTIKDHYLSAQWKKFFDRSFFNGHVPVLKGKRIGFIISGPLGQIQNLHELLDVFVTNWHMNPIGIVTDEHERPDEVTAQIKAFVSRLSLSVKHNPGFGSRFYQIGGNKIFRDFVFAASAVFRADDIFYKKMGLYRTFPQRRIKKRVQNFLFSVFLTLKPIRKKIHEKFIPAMVAPYKKVLDKYPR